MDKKILKYRMVNQTMKKELDFSPSSLEERKRFYQKEFSISRVKKWFKSNGLELPRICAIDAGTESKIILDKKLMGNILYFGFEELKEKIKKYLPEDIYYDRNVYKNPKKVLRELEFRKFISQELVFDIDVDNLDCICRKGGKKGEVCDKCIKKAYGWAVKMRKKLLKSFEKIRIIYSGRGFHVHVLDKKAFKLSIRERTELNKKFLSYPIDPWVSKGYIRLIRLPYSLHGLVSRVVVPIDISKGFIKNKTIPKFRY